MWSDEELTERLGDAYDDASRDVAPSADLARAVRRKHAVSARHRTAVGVTVTGVVAVAAVGSALASTQSSPGTSTTPADSTVDSVIQPGTFHLAGHTFSLPPEYAAKPGSCTVRLPDGTAREGIPGARSACAVAWVAEEPPSWLPKVPPHDYVALGQDGSMHTVVARVPENQGSGFVVITTDMPNGGYVNLSKMIKKALSE